MTTKQMAQEVIEGLPKNATIDDIMYALYVRAKFEEGDKDIRDGHGVPQEEAVKRLRKWVKSSGRGRRCKTSRPLVST